MTDLFLQNTFKGLGLQYCQDEEFLSLNIITNFREYIINHTALSLF